MYMPAQNFYGTDSFQYTVTDSNGGMSNASATITVISVDDAPTSNNDSAYTTLGNPVWINVLSNDTDVDEDILRVTSIGPILHGTASVVNSGSAIVYTPDDGFAGDDQFTYTVSDGTLTSIGTVSVHVYPFKFGHIQSPVGDGSHEFQQGNTANVRFKLTDQNGNEVTDATVILQIQQVDSSDTPIGPLMDATSSGDSNDGNYFKYSASGTLYQYNLKTDTMAVGKWALYAYLIDSSTQPSTHILLENAPIDGISTMLLIK
jgi:hypothetical protein